MKTHYKQSGDKLDFDEDFSDWLPEGDVVQLAEVVVDKPEELTLHAVQWDGQVVKTWLLGGVNGATYKITVTAYTAGGRIKESEFKLRIKDY